MCRSNQPRENKEISCGCSRKLAQNDKTVSLEFNDLESGKLLALSRRKRNETNGEDLHKKILISCCIRGVEKEIDRRMRETFDLW